MRAIAFALLAIGADLSAHYSREMGNDEPMKWFRFVAGLLSAAFMLTSLILAILGI
jgi:hypothetical protein